MKTDNPSSALRVLLVSPGESSSLAGRTEALRLGLLDSHYDLIALLHPDSRLGDRIARLRPDLIVVDSAADPRGVLADTVAAMGEERCPIVLFTEDGSAAAMEAAMAAGVSAYVVAGLRVERVRPVLDVALARFRREQALLGELNDTRLRLAERKLVERAKGLLMARQQLSENEAYRRLRSMAMSRQTTMAAIARRILDVEDLLG